MEKIKPIRYAVVFPGQGSQYVGMGQEFPKLFPSAMKILELAEQVTDLPIQHLSFSSSEEILRETTFTQPCLLAISMAAYTVFQEHFPIKPEFLCGHSAGEYAALAASHVISFSDAIKLIQMRGKLMSQMAEGGMVALIDVTLEEAKTLCIQAVQTNGTLVVANLNSPAQIVISGDSESIESAICIAFEKNIKAIPLQVSAAFHSPLMQEVALNFAKEFSQFRFNNAVIPVISNVTSQPVIQGCKWVELLEKQITAPVQWIDTIHYILQQGIKIFVEVGPNKVLSKLIQKITPSAITLNIEDVNSLEFTITELQNSLNTTFVS
ncbi:ACP S-malonyltransferase [Nostoc sp.]|uniref:ACP S-malonyltransferase n=1 Tax=Nostoc sp. TaxID=1180 RepID=UPI002FFD2B5B